MGWYSVWSISQSMILPSPSSRTAAKIASKVALSSSASWDSWTAVPTVAAAAVPEADALVSEPEAEEPETETLEAEEPEV